MALQRALTPAAGPTEFVYVNFDETGMYMLRPERLIVPVEQIEARRDLMVFERTEYRYSLGLTVTSELTFQVPPLVLVHKCRAVEKTVMSILSEVTSSKY